MSQLNNDQTTGWKRTYLEQILNDFLMTLRPENSHLQSQSGHTNNSPRGSGGPGTNIAVSQLALTRTMSPGQGSTATLSRAQLLSDMRSARASNDAASSLEEMALQLSMSPQDERNLTELCAICQDYVQVVTLPCQVVHLSLWSQLLSKLPHVHTVTLTYNVRNAGIGYDRRMTSFNDQDANYARELLLKDVHLHTLRLPANKLLATHVKIIASGMVDNHTLRTLDLSSNALDDTVAEVLALLLCKPGCVMEALYLHDNNIAASGARALSEALTRNNTLRVLQLSQNRIPDGHWGEGAEGAESGAANIIAALSSHDTLVELYLGYNKLSEQTVLALRDTLPLLHTLQRLDIAGNTHIGGCTKQTSSPPSGAVASDPTSTSADKVPANVFERGTSELLPQEGGVPSSDVRPCLSSHSDCQDGNVGSSVVRSPSDGRADTTAPVGNGDETQAVRSGSQTTTTAVLDEEQPCNVAPQQASTTESTQPTTAAQTLETMEHSEHGELLCQAIRDQHCLFSFDARGCNLTKAELSYIRDVMLEHAHQRRMTDGG